MFSRAICCMAIIFFASAVNAEEINLLCSGQRTSIFVPSLNGPDTQNIVLTKSNGKVVKAVVLDFNNSYTLMKTNTQTDGSKPPKYSQLIVETDRIILRNISSDGDVLDAIIHNSGKFEADAGISIVVGQCENKPKLF